MSKGYDIAVVGATGAVGVEMIETLEKRGFPVKNLRLFASERSVGKKLKYKGTDIGVELLKAGIFDGIDFALFSAGASRSKEFAHGAAKQGAVVIDNSSAFRMEPDVPLVVPEVNPGDAKLHKGIIANPNCSTAILLVALYPLHKANPVKRVVVATYQAASGAGAKAMAELEEQRHLRARAGLSRPQRVREHRVRAAHDTRRGAGRPVKSAGPAGRGRSGQQKIPNAHRCLGDVRLSRGPHSAGRVAR